VIDKTVDILSHGLVRRQSTTFTLSYIHGELTLANRVYFVDADIDCVTAVLPVQGISATSFSTVPATGNTVEFNFQSIRMANRLMKVCEFNAATNALTKHYQDIGVVVSDITIMGSDKFDTLTAGCVANKASQTVSFSQSSFLAFDSTAKLFFKRQQASNKACGSAPKASTTSSSDAVLMSFIDQTGSTVDWSMAFDFSLSVPNLAIYRLCVELSSGTVLDYNPLGVRVSDITITSVVANLFGTNSVKPLSGQQLHFEFADSADVELSNSYAWFIDSSNTYLTCPCSSPTSTGSADCKGNSGISSAVTVSTGLTYEFDFSSFKDDDLKQGIATMCVQRKTTGVIAYSLPCVQVSFNVGLSPASLPANTMQMVKFEFQGGSLTQGDQVMFVHPQSKCDATTPAFGTAHTLNARRYSTSATVGSSGNVLLFDFDQMRYGNDIEVYLCVNDTATKTVFPLKGSTLKITPAVVGLSGDPHVRAADGKWLDFYGEAGVYQLLDGEMQANAQLGYAVRDNFMIWHPKVMRAGTVVEEVAIKLQDTRTSIRLGIQGGGIVSIRQGSESTDFWAASEDQSLQLGDYTVNWSQCTKDCEQVMPWGVHQRSRSLTVQGRGEFIQLFVAKSGGYRFIDIEAIPASDSSGLLADASAAPADLVERLSKSGESIYRLSAALPHSF